MSDLTPNLNDWVFVKERGATTKSGSVYHSAEGKYYLRTGKANAIRAEAEFGREARRQGFPVPEVTEIGQFPDGLGYFIEPSAGTETFAEMLGSDYAASGRVSDATFDAFCEIVLRFLAAQLNPDCRPPKPSQLRNGVQLANVQRENPEIADLLDKAVVKAGARLEELPLVLTHGDLSPLNILRGGIIDFEERFVAPAGLDAVTAIAFQRLWDHPTPDGTGTMRLWDFSREQIAEFMTRTDALFTKQDLAPLSVFFDDFLMLKAIWALSYERPDDLQSPQVKRWQWRQRVGAYCAGCILADTPIESEQFRAIGLAQD